MVKAEA